DRLTAAEGLAVNDPTKIATVRVDGRDYILLGSAGTGSVTVVELTRGGALGIRDQVNDDRATRFDGLTVLETATADGRAYVVAGGADDGLTLMALLPGGRLVHLDTIADSAGLTLDNPAALALSVRDGWLEIH